MVVGGGEVASRKACKLLQAGAEVVVISPEVSPELSASKVELHRRPYRGGDLAGAHLAFTATDSREVNAAVARPAGLIRASGVERAARKWLQTSGRDAQPLQVILH